jgi:hypothetical protein
MLFTFPSVSFPALSSNLLPHAAAAAAGKAITGIGISMSALHLLHASKECQRHRLAGLSLLQTSDAIPRLHHLLKARQVYQVRDSVLHRSTPFTFLGRKKGMRAQATA